MLPLAKTTAPTIAAAAHISEMAHWRHVATPTKIAIRIRKPARAIACQMTAAGETSRANIPAAAPYGSDTKTSTTPRAASHTSQTATSIRNSTIGAMTPASRNRSGGTAAINGPRPTSSPPRMTMTASPLHRVVLGRVDQAVGLPPRDGPILPPLGGCRPQALARYPSRESSGDVQPWNRVECDSGSIDASSGWAPHQSP